MTELITTIIAATVYPEYVRINRRGTIKLNKGNHTLEISKLPLSINPDSLRASIYGAASPRLLSAQVKRVLYPDLPTDPLQKLGIEIEKMKDDLKRLEVKLELIKQNRNILDKLADQVDTYATALAAGEKTVEQQLDYFAKLRKQAEKLDDEMFTLQTTQRQLTQQLEKSSKELEQYLNSRPHECYTASIDVEVFSHAEMTIEISYVASEAGWKPVYDLRLLEKAYSPSLEVSYLADVTQNTGETWDEISLTLSTARPALTSTLPELEPWYINPPEPIYPVATLGIEPQLLPADMTKEPLAVNIPGTFLGRKGERHDDMAALVTTVGTSVSYLIPNPVTIPSDGAPHKVNVAHFPLAPVVDYVSTPKLANAVYRRAKADNKSPYTLLPGQANILISDEYVGSTQLELTVPEGKIEIYLGNDSRLKVERELKRREIDRRLLGGKTHLAYGYEITVESMLPYSANLTVYDQIPTPRYAEIKVKLESAEPKPTDQSGLNQLIWSLALDPKEKRTIRFDFSVEIPQDLKVIGLP
jgi:uncharacterized protein (TIGR02231 family)